MRPKYLPRLDYSLPGRTLILAALSRFFTPNLVNQDSSIRHTTCGVRSLPRPRWLVGLRYFGRVGFPSRAMWHDPRRFSPGKTMPTRALLYRRPTEPQALEVYFDKAIYLVRLRRHRQARRYTLRIHNATREVVLTMPPRGSLKEAQEFAQKHGGWIAARLHRLPEAAPFSHGTIIPLRGVPHRIMHRPGARGTVWTDATTDGDRLLCVAGETPYVDRRVSDFLKREARRDLEAA